MLSAQERHEIAEELPRYPVKQAVCIEALKIVQKHRGGWVDDVAIKDLAKFLEMTPEELDAVATGYNLIFRKPVGRHVILLCNSVSCWIMRYEDLRAHLLKRLELTGFGQTTADGRFTLLPIVCLGLCDHAPAMMIDDETYGDLTAEKIDRILEQHR